MPTRTLMEYTLTPSLAIYGSSIAQVPAPAMALSKALPALGFHDMLRPAAVKGQHVPPFLSFDFKATGADDERAYL